jgi:phosphatidylglycerol:prolipoprotein diacylglycerol transferase
MHPELFHAGPFTVYSYGVLLGAAYLIGLQVAMARARTLGLDPQKFMDLGIAIIVSALIGAKLLLFILDFDHFVANPGDLVSLARSGGVFYGGLVLAVLVGIWYVRKHHLPVWTTGDLAAPGIALGYAVGRMGCFFAGCCWGAQTDVPWAITFTDPIANEVVGTPLNVPLHPTQVYESLSGLAIFLLILAFERKGRPFAGRTFWGYILLYGVSRFVIEYFRGDPRGVNAGFSTSQWISIVLVPLSIAMLTWLSRAGTPAPAGARA